jgi:hypothetical protein
MKNKSFCTRLLGLLFVGGLLLALSAGAAENEVGGNKRKQKEDSTLEERVVQLEIEVKRLQDELKMVKGAILYTPENIRNSPRDMRRNWPSIRSRTRDIESNSLSHREYERIHAGREVVYDENGNVRTENK